MVSVCDFKGNSGYEYLHHSRQRIKSLLVNQAPQINGVGGQNTSWLNMLS